MAKRPEPRNRQRGDVAQGWVKQGLVIPDHTRQRVVDEATGWGHHSVKLIGTTALNLLFGLPAEVREQLLLAEMKSLRERPDGMTAEETWCELQRLLHIEVSVKTPEGQAAMGAGSAGPDPLGGRTYVVSRILDPEVTPEPGRKASDRAGRKAAGA